MAEKILQKVEDEFTTCSICLDTYINPKLLQCFHVYCQGCLRKLVFRDQQEQLVLTCPNCRQVTPVPAGGVAGLQSAFQTNRLLGIMEEHKKGGKDKPAHAKNSSTSNTQIMQCSEHLDEQVKFYCEACEKLICWKCVYSGKHHNHDHGFLDEAFEKYKKEISSSLRPVEKQMATINQAMEQLDTCHRKITNQQVMIKADIHTTIGQLQESLSVRKTQLINQLDQITQNKLEILTSQKNQLETTQAQLRSCLDFVKKSMDTDSRSDVLKMKTSVVKQVKELTFPFQPDLLKPCTVADTMYSASADTLKLCQNYGRLFSLSLPDPSKCHATGNGLEAANVEDNSTAVLHAVNYKGEPCSQPISSLECQLVSEIAGTTTKIERIEQNKYEISYHPIIKGKHHLHVKVEGQHIKGSPFNVAVKSFFQGLGTPIHSIQEVDGPYGVALNLKQEPVVSGYQDHCIHVFSPDGKKLLSFGSHGSGYGQFQSPVGVAVDRVGNILVVDEGNHRVQKFTVEGRFITAVGTRGTEHLQFDCPDGIASSNNKVYITDTYNHRVQVLNSDLSFFSSFGRRGRNKGQFSYPRGITCDSTGKVYVADYRNSRVQVFTAEGKFLRAFGSYGKGKGELACPSNIAVDADGMVYVSEVNSHRVSVFTPEGKFVKAFGEHGNKPGQFEDPRGVAVDGNGVVYVCDNNRIQMF